jgi:hypothetical protein
MDCGKIPPTMLELETAMTLLLDCAATFQTVAQSNGYLFPPDVIERERWADLRTTTLLKLREFAERLETWGYSSIPLDKVEKARSILERTEQVLTSLGLPLGSVTLQMHLSSVVVLEPMLKELKEILGRQPSCPL